MSVLKSCRKRMCLKLVIIIENLWFFLCDLIYYNENDFMSLISKIIILFYKL